MNTPTFELGRSSAEFIATLEVVIDDKEVGSIAVQTKSLASQDDLIIGKRFTGKLADIVVSAE